MRRNFVPLNGLKFLHGNFEKSVTPAQRSAFAGQPFVQLVSVLFTKSDATTGHSFRDAKRGQNDVLRVAHQRRAAGRQGLVGRQGFEP
jgi:hypothetical protein